MVTIQEAVTFILETAEIRTREDLTRRGGNQFLYERVYFMASDHCNSRTTWQAGVRAKAQTLIHGYKRYIE